ncbi:dienelactone hydrolase family protein [Hymenobacter sp. IS2118]|uniref:dienelactone hydrolase family protein n=1 Tax=Hymenobacter sp. IS2118 TaxID=1505605 RepID=UPI00054FA5F5|nr:dienelactone hydrolase family protein [Hymenobacter sp. IS2118]
MKKLLTLGVALLSLTFSASAQQMASCCAKPAGNLSASATEAFAMLAADKDFSGGHDAPLPFEFKGEGQNIEFKTADGTMGRGFEIKSATPSNKYLFVIHEWWGLNDYIKKEAATFAAEMPGVNVIAVDLYDGKVATTPEEAGKFMGEVKSERAVAILKGAQAYAGPKAQFASVGWCFGGGWSLQQALIGGKQSVGCVMYYGMPEKDVAKLKTLNTDVLAIFASQDKWINPEVAAQFKKDMAAAGEKVIIESYDADHAFANPSNPKFNQAYAASAHAKALTYLRTKFKVKA